MTCIAGLLDKGNIYMGGDSAGVGGRSLTIRADEKIFIRGDFLIGFTSSFRMGQLLRYSLNIPTQSEEIDTYEYMVTFFIDAVRKCLRDGGYATKDKEVETAGVFLVGYRGRLFRVDDDYQVAESILPYEAVGCGADIALGTLFANEHLESADRIEQALEAAEQFNTGVRHPFIIKLLKPTKTVKEQE